MAVFVSGDIDKSWSMVFYRPESGTPAKLHLTNTSNKTAKEVVRKISKTQAIKITCEKIISKLAKKEIKTENLETKN